MRNISTKHFKADRCFGIVYRMRTAILIDYTPILKSHSKKKKCSHIIYMDKHNIFNWNHVSEKLTEDQIFELKALYKFYHKKYWLAKMTHKYYKKAELTCNIGSALLVVTGTVVGGVTLNPVVLGTISGAGLLLKTYSEAKNYKRKIEMSKFAYTSYSKVLTDLRSFMRGLKYDEKEFLDYVKVVDEIIIDMCPLTDKFEKKYNKVFIQE